MVVLILCLLPVPPIIFKGRSHPFDVVLIIYHLQCNFFLDYNIPKHLSIPNLKVLLQGLHLLKKHNTWTALGLVFLPPLFDHVSKTFHLKPHTLSFKLLHGKNKHRLLLGFNNILGLLFGMLLHLFHTQAS